MVEAAGSSETSSYVSTQHYISDENLLHSYYIILGLFLNAALNNKTVLSLKKYAFT